MAVPDQDTIARPGEDRTREKWKAGEEASSRRLRIGPPRKVLPVVAYVAGEFPKLSETFVYREVRALRGRGHGVECVSLHPTQNPVGLEDLADRVVNVYDGAPGLVADAALELLRHPIRGIGTVVTAVKDAINPGEKTSLATRLKLPAQALAGLAVARRLRARKVGRLHAHFAHAPATVAMYAARQLRVPFSFTGHANDLFQRRSLLKRKLQRAAAVACISHWHRELYLSIHPAAVKYHVVRCGVDTKAFACRSNVDEKAGSAARPVRVLTVCRLVEKKGVDTLILGLDQAHQRLGLEWKLTVAGDGPDRERLVELAKRLKVEERIEWLGAVDNVTVAKLMAGHDLFALPCRADSSGDKDGIPVVLMEAMACGVAVVAGDLPAIRELVVDGESGYLVAGADVAGVADRVNELARDGELRGRMGMAGRDRVEEEFGLHTNVVRLEECLASVSSWERR